MIDKDRVEHAKNYSILDIAERLGIEIKRNNQAYCYNGHDSKTPSLTFYPTTNTFHCFGCKDGGDTIKLVRLYFKSKSSELSFKEALDFILGSKQSSPLPLSQNFKKTRLKQLKINQKKDCQNYTDIYEYFINMLSFPDENSYLVKDRGLSLTVLKENNIRAIDSSKTWDYRNKLLQKFPEEELIKSGILSINKKNNGSHISFWKCCAVFPYYSNDKISYLQGCSKIAPKINNLSEKVYKPLLYLPKNFNSYIKEKSTKIWLCEGVIDCLSAITMDKKAVSIIDAGLKSNLVELETLKPFSIILALDSDNAGFNAKLKLSSFLSKNFFKYHNLNMIDYGKKELNNNSIIIKDMNDILKYKRSYLCLQKNK